MESVCNPRETLQLSGWRRRSPSQNSVYRDGETETKLYLGNATSPVCPVCPMNWLQQGDTELGSHHLCPGQIRVPNWSKGRGRRIGYPGGVWARPCPPYRPCLPLVGVMLGILPPLSLGNLRVGQFFAPFLEEEVPKRWPA